MTIAFAPFKGWARWAACFVLVLAAHASAAAFILRHAWIDDALSAGAPVMVVALSPLAEAPDAPDLAPAPIVSQAEPESSPAAPNAESDREPEQASPVVPAQPAPNPDLPTPAPMLEPEPPATVATLPPPRPIIHSEPKHKPHPERHASIDAAPPHAERRSRRTAIPREGATAHDPNAATNWKSRLVAQIERHKRYPAEAQARGEQGVAQVAFSVDRGGGLHHVRLVRSAGSALLDHDALAWLARSAPLPPPPPDVTGTLIPLVVPLRYIFR